MQLTMYQSSTSAIWADALFVSVLQGSDKPDAMRTDALRAMIRPLHRRNLRFREDSHWRAHSDLYLGLSTGSTSKAGCLGAMARIRSSLESGPVPSKKTPTSAFHFLR